MMKKTDDDAKSTDVGVETTGSSDISEQNNLDDTTKNKENKEKTHLRKKKPTNYTQNRYAGSAIIDGNVYYQFYSCLENIQHYSIIMSSIFDLITRSWVNV